MKRPEYDKYEIVGKQIKHKCEFFNININSTIKTNFNCSAGQRTEFFKVKSRNQVWEI
jgi:hypothetical protein